MTINKTIKNSTNQRGFVSIIVTLIIMIVLTLIVIGFAQLSRREQRAALDRQLSTQAYYAAESGINDLWAVMKDPNNANYFFNTNPSRTNCDDSWGGSNFTPKDPNPTDNVKYTCLLYNNESASLQYRVATDQVTVAPITNRNLGSGTLTINWDSTTGPASYRGPGTSKSAPFPTQSVANWPLEHPGVLRIMIIPLKDDPSRQYLIDNTFTGFLYPETGGPSSVAYDKGIGANTSGVIVPGNCVAGAGCTVKITALPNSLPRGFYIVMRSIYNPSIVKITSKNGGGADTTLAGAQVTIDATGQADDVLRRVQVRKPLKPVCGDFCPVGFTAMNSICKEIELIPGATGGDVIEGDGNGTGKCTFNFPT